MQTRVLSVEELVIGGAAILYDLINEIAVYEAEYTKNDIESVLPAIKGHHSNLIGSSLCVVTIISIHEAAVLLSIGGTDIWLLLLIILLLLWHPLIVVTLLIIIIRAITRRCALFWIQERLSYLVLYLILLVINVFYLGRFLSISLFVLGGGRVLSFYLRAILQGGQNVCVFLHLKYYKII